MTENQSPDVYIENPLVQQAAMMLHAELEAQADPLMDVPVQTVWDPQECAILTLIDGKPVQARPGRLFLLMASLAQHLHGGPDPEYKRDPETGTYYVGESRQEFEGRASSLLPRICYALNERLRSYEGLIEAVSAKKVYTAFTSPITGRDGLPCLALNTVSDTGQVFHQELPLSLVLFVLRGGDLQIAVDDSGKLDIVSTPALDVYRGIEQAYTEFLQSTLPKWEQPPTQDA